VEDRDSPSANDPPRFDIPADTLPPHIPQYLQTSSFGTIFDEISSAASSPSAAYATLSLEGDRNPDPPGSDTRTQSLAPNEQDTRGHSPRIFSHRSIMGGAAETPHRSSSPLKRRASDLEGEAASSENDVDMIPVPTSDLVEPEDLPTLSTPSSDRSKRSESIDMLRDEIGPAPVNGSNGDEVPPRDAAETGKAIKKNND
jgi:ubiquitin carboxyl-terminal hydrolase 4/11/15